MKADFITRRDFSIRLATLLPSLGLAGTARLASAAPADGIVNDAEAIHMERTFKASRKRVYEALTESARWDQVVRLSAAMRPGVPAGSPPSAVSPAAGGEYVGFGGYVAGRVIELLPPERMVLAWRAASWGPGLYSIARFEFAELGPGATRLVFDHQGFPRGEAQHLAAGWVANYWEPLEKYLA
jgi:uncharacterized protein YndB with AHSA1/START domain